jgi:hypothetical protein
MLLILAKEFLLRTNTRCFNRFYEKAVRETWTKNVGLFQQSVPCIAFMVWVIPFHVFIVWVYNYTGWWVVVVVNFL